MFMNGARLARALGFWREFLTWFTSLTGFYIMALIPNLLLLQGVFLLYLIDWKSHQLLHWMAHYNSEEGLVIYPMSENSAMLKFILQTWENELAICSLILLKVGKEKLFGEENKVICFMFRKKFFHNNTVGEQGRHHINFFGLGGYVNLGPFILGNIRNLLKALQKQSSWKLVA